MYKRREFYMMRKILLEGKELEYELVYKNVRNINIRIKPGGMVTVSASQRVPLSYIEDFFRMKSEEILRSVRKYEKIKPAESDNLTDGSTVYFMGRPLTLKVESAESNMVTMSGDTLIVYSAGSSTGAIIDAWYDTQCRRILKDIGHSVYERFRQYVPHEPVYSYKKMKTLWGSCNPVKCRMSINRELVKYDERLIEFVFCHEYTHFIHPDHSPDFYNFMSGIMPDHKLRRSELKKAASIIRDGEEPESA